MKQLILDSTALAQWQSLVQEAQSACDRSLDEALESYLVFMLMRFTDKPLCISRIMAEEYLAAQSLSGEQRVERLRDVGDHCLLFSGLFPQLAERRLVRNSYFVNLGQASYHQLSKVIDRGWSAIYGHLSDTFVVLMDILQSMRELGGGTAMTPLQSLELWQDTGSRRCYERVNGNGRSMVIPNATGKH